MNPADPPSTDVCELGPAEYDEVLTLWTRAGLTHAGKGLKSIPFDDEVLTLWTRAGLPVRATGRDAPDAFACQIAGGRQRVIGLRADGLLVAVAVLTHDGRKGWINRLAVDPAYQRRGLARTLIAEAERWFAQDLGLEVWAALIEGHNHESQALFAALGFRPHDVLYVSKRLRSEA